MYKISIIVPFYNTISSVGEHYLNKNINSLINQTYKNIEVIYINNNSSDESANFIKEKISSDTRFKIVNETKSGVSNARNKGIDESTGDYITFVDSDDFVGDNYINMAILKLNNNKNLDILIGKFTIYDDKTGNICPNLRTTAIDKFGTNIEDVFTAIECSPNIFFRTEFIKKNNIRQNPNISIGEDNLFNFTAIVKANIDSKRIEFLESQLYYYIIHPVRINTALEDKYMTLIIAYEKMLTILNNYNKINNVAIWYFNVQYNNFSNRFGYDSTFSKEFANMLKKYNIIELTIQYQELENQHIELTRELKTKINLLSSMFGVFGNSDKITIVLFFIKISLKVTKRGIDKIAWWIPVRKWRDKFRSRFN